MAAICGIVSCSGTTAASCGSEFAVVDADVGDVAFEAQPRTRADAERTLALHRPDQLIEEDLDLLRLAVHIDVHSRGSHVAVVGDEHVLPVVQLDGLLGFEAQAEIAPAEDDVEADLAVDQIHAVTLAFHVIVGVGEDGALGGVGFDPGARR